MNGTIAQIAIWGYGIAAAAFLAFAAQLGLGWRGNLRGRMVLAAVLLSFGWTAAVCAALALRAPAWLVAAGLLDSLRLGAWFAFAYSTIAVPELRPDRKAANVRSGPWWPGYAIGVFIAAHAAMQAGAPALIRRFSLPERTEFALPLAAAILGLVLSEQIYRNTPQHARWSMKPICLGLAGVFAFDLYLYADAFLFSRLDPDAWSTRGVVQAMVIPFVAVSAARNREWSFEISVSRQVVFHSAALLTSGVYLLLVASAGYYLRYFGGSWGRAVEITFVFAALLVLATLLVSGSLRSRLRVMLNKHFFSYRYDYREEWLKFTQALSSRDQHPGVRVLAIKALADLVESPGGYLWLRDRDGRYVTAARWNLPERIESEPSGGALAGFLRNSKWVIDLAEWRADPDKYENLVVPGWLLGMSEAWLVVPLNAAEDLIGFVVLNRPRTRLDVNWEVTDLLKTAGQQAAGFLGQLQAMEALLEARKFDAFNRMSAFVVHDLKNLVAQLSLMLKNAERHHDNPEFRKDMLATIAHVVERMNGLLLQLRSGATPIDPPKAVDLGELIERIRDAKKTQRPSVEIDVVPEVLASGHADRLERVIGHLVQNALDATAQSGRVWVRLRREGGSALVEVGDTGHGMTPEFVRERLFKPFQSTKSAGMGIGAFESAQYVSELGGRISVNSERGVGTTVRVSLPLHGAGSITLAQTKAAA